LKPGTVVGSIFIGILGFLMCLTIILLPLGALLMIVAFVFFIYGLVASPPAPIQYVAAPCPTCGQPLSFVQQYNRWYCYNCMKYPSAPPASYAPSAVTLCPQCKSPLATDANYCPKCGADTRSRAKEIVKEKEIIIKIRCRYCDNLYDETLDKCPHCGAQRS
jgi:RNA polymerase subunit RPABC4/transcription elongation factor Spt4